MQDELLGDRYRLEQCLDSGGMGQVWGAVDHRLQRPVAVKLVPGAPGPRGVAVERRFVREVLTAAGFPSPHTVTVHDWGEAVWAGRRHFYLVMERLDGRTLAEEFRRAPRPPWQKVVHWSSRIASALASAHARGIVHRDIKPQNVVVTADGRVKVLDFGIAAFLGDTWRLSALTPEGKVVGTPQYMSPEQCRGEKGIGPRSDLYSLGCLMYEGLAGAPPFTADSVLGLIYKQVHAEVPPLGKAAAGVPYRIEHLVMRLLAKEPGARPADADAVLRELRAVRRARQWRESATARRRSTARAARTETAARSRAAAMTDQALLDAAVIRAQAQRLRVGARRDAEEAELRRREAELLLKETRARMDRATADLEWTLRDRRAEADRELADRRAAVEEALVEVRERAERDRAEAEWDRDEAERDRAEAERDRAEAVQEAERALAAAADDTREMLARASWRSREVVCEALDRAERLRAETAREQAAIGAERAELAARLDSLRDRLLAPPGGGRGGAVPAARPGGGAGVARDLGADDVMAALRARLSGQDLAAGGAGPAGTP
ncbi:protein kinase [Streptomyces sp. NPDC048270]|uniref:serine/threonine protein kinase n=1 Tax=Streptomyces sp. NPDC048270 TaxID=3154615 RepID=UPI0034027060